MILRPCPLRGLVLSAVLLLSIAAGPARAQTPAAAPAPSASPAAAPVSTDELQRLVATLQDEGDRKKLIDQLQALIAAQRGAEQQEAEGPAGLLANLSQGLDAVSEEILAAAGVLIDAPRIIDWLQNQASDEGARRRWVEIGLKLGVIFGAAFIVEWLARLLLRGLSTRLAAKESETTPMRLVLLLLCGVAELVPVVAFVAAAWFVQPLTQPHFSTRQVSSVVIRAYFWAQGILALARVLLLSRSAAALIRITEETRNYLYIWVRRFTHCSVYGFALASGAWWLGVPGAIYALVLRGTLLVLAILAIIFVLQNRTGVAEWLRGRGNGDEEETAPHRNSHAWRVFRHRLADTWHVLAILYVVGIFGVYVLHIEGGFLAALQATLESLVVVIAAALIVRFAQRLSRRGFAVSPELKARFPTIELRANRYLPILTLVISSIVYLCAAMALMQAWGIDAFAWVASNAGRRLTGSFLTIAIVLFLGLLVWEVFSSALERYLVSLDGAGRTAAQAARLRTLLPLLRTTVMGVIIAIVGLIVLSEIGVNIAPLLAGAGIVGIAVGFGSQALVKDFITGLFMLIEDTFAVGDVVDLGKGHTGVIDGISLRTIRLRDVAGFVHTVPFSEVSSVRNMTRDFAYVVCDAGVLYSADPDHVMAVLRQVGDQFANDPVWKHAIMSPLEIIGIDRFTDSAVVIRSRIKAAPLRQWEIAREFNRRMKKAFDANGIEMPSANQTHYLAPPAGGSAPSGAAVPQLVEEST